jgi:magnesium chelatase family protein
MLPPMTPEEAIDTTRIHRVAGLTGDRTALVTTRPCRAPHHTISDVGLIGGGRVPMPGDVSRAHHGVLCLDALPQCRRHVLDVLRQVLEKRIVTITRRSITDFIPSDSKITARSLASAFYGSAELVLPRVEGLYH